MLLAPWRMTVAVETVSGGISEAIGPAFIIFLPLVFLMRSRKRLFLKTAVYCLLSFLLIYLTSPRPRTRYYLPLMPLTAACVGAGLLFLKRYSRPALFAARAVVLLSVAGGLAVASLYAVPFAKAVFGLTPRTEFLSRSTDFYSEYLWMDANLPPQARLAIQATNDLYYSPRPSYRLGVSSGYTHCDSRAFFSLDDESAPDLALARLRALGVTHLFVGAGFISESSPSSAGRLLARLEKDGSLARIRLTMADRGTRNPFSSQRHEAVALYELRGAGGLQ